MCDENSSIVFLLRFMVLLVLIFAMRAVLMLWHAFLLLGLRAVRYIFSSFFLFAWWFPLVL
jgi:hypothetical protein